MSIVVGLFIGWAIGFIHGHYKIATECKRLGKFYVDDDTFECVLIETVEKKNDQLQ